MLICAVESSAKAVSVAVVENETIIGETFVNTKQTHSETLMPMLENIMNITGTTVGDFELFAVSNGPGSFTGVRIGVSCIKGLAFPFQTQCCGVSTLEAIAQSGRHLEGKTICAVMDARRNQVYNALFKIENGQTFRICEDRAISIANLYEEQKELGDSLVLFGDGAELCYETFKENGSILANESIRLPHASAVAVVANKLFIQGRGVLPEMLLPFYLRPSQAERERKKMEDAV